MFFLGSTGPILTFLLTFILPLFLLTAKQTSKTVFSIADNPVTLSIQSHAEYSNDFENSITQENYISCADNLYADWFVKNITKIYPVYKYPRKNLFVNLNYSGNKAPPMFC
ncbi:MAG: hypothetical protein HQ541_08155 [Mariniphaga sp.]|nr:hypothetical protein [Mariniphaga sp.]